MSAAVIGGTLLIIGAWFTYRGNIYQSVAVYMAADLCWVYIAYDKDDLLGAVMVTIGLTLGLLAFLKMNSGKMNKTLNKEKI